MDIETKVTIRFLESNPSGLKKYLNKRYKNEINQIIKKLEIYFNEKIGIHYTFEDGKTSWNSDLDFYLVENKNKYPIANAGNRKLPVCFVINPPGYKKPNSENWIIEDESFYLVTPFSKEHIKWLYKKRVTDISWSRIFKKVLSTKLENR